MYLIFNLKIDIINFINDPYSHFKPEHISSESSKPFADRQSTSMIKIPY